ncbi:MAG: hypothetical protein J6K04_13480 [Lachnospiraceae bacterium]|nr:hypothetical protein [Lachnospiraceae bacterium]MBP3570162.1 hypothetical protein [Lachnospiraceae bacterium]
MSKREAPPAVGGSSLLVIFAVLCLTIFALLSLSTVQADRRLAEASAEAVQKYYEADVKAEVLLASIRQGQVPADAVEKNGEVYYYRQKVSEVQALEVEVKVSDEEYEIMRWQLVSTTEWEEDDSMDVWNGSLE